MPEAYRDLVNRVLRDHEGYTGDGRGGVGELPVGDRSTARKGIDKRDLREALLAGETAVDTAVEAATQAAAYAAAASGTPHYATRQLAESTNVPAFATVISVGGAMFAKDAAGTALVSGDGARWSPAGMVTPLHFGAIPHVDVDQSARFNAMADWVRTQYDTANGAFRYGIDLMGLTWRVDSWNLTNIRQPAFTFGNGTIMSRGAGRVVVDCSGTNHGRIMGELSIEAPERANAPAVGLLIGRAGFGGSTAPIAPDWAGNVRIDGYFTKAAMVNFASECSNFRAHLTNRARSMSAVCLAHSGHAGTFNDYIGGVASQYATLPTASSGAHSNILHDYGSLICKRQADVVLDILGISQTNPVTVTVDPAALAAADFANGSEIYFHDHGGMSEIKHRVLKIASLNTAAGTFTLREVDGTTPVNGSGYSAWTGGGRVWSATGPAVLLGPIRALRTRAAYFLTYGSPSVIIDATRGTLSDIQLDFQQEAHPSTAIRINIGASAAIIQRPVINLTAANQEAGTSFIQVQGAGTLRIDNADVTIAGYAGTPSDSVWGGRGLTTIRGGVFKVPVAADLPTSGWAGFTGTIHAADTMSITGVGVGTAPPRLTAAQIGSATHWINTTGKQSGKMVWDTTGSRLLYASNGDATGTWRDLAGAIQITPA